MHCFIPKDLNQPKLLESPDYNSAPSCADSHDEQLTLQSPLLSQFLLVLFPLPNYMLKFSRSFYLTEG
jgi:hypothetical protein